MKIPVAKLCSILAISVCLVSILRAVITYRDVDDRNPGMEVDNGNLGMKIDDGNLGMEVDNGNLNMKADNGNLGMEADNGKPDYLALFQNVSEDFDSHQVGCGNLSGPVDAYIWRRPGYGSNINFLLVPWVNALQLGRMDLAVILTKNGTHVSPPGLFDAVKCTTESNGVETAHGFSCLFAAMPHLCVFQTEKDWERFMIERNISTKAREDALSRDGLASDRRIKSGLKRRFEHSKIDLLSAMSILLDHLHSHWQPWLKRGIQSILDEPTIAAVREVPYISIHVRRGDKLIHEAKAHDVEDYLKAASSYIINSKEAAVSIEDVRGIWVSSDDESVISDVKETFPELFPNVEHERVVWISGRSFTNDTGTSKDPLRTMTQTMDYESYVVFFTELTMMAEGNVFVGTFSSNVARMLVIWREAKGWPRSSTLSVDQPSWHPGRRLLLSE